jgi:hypothetical protein
VGKLHNRVKTCCGREAIYVSSNFLSCRFTKLLQIKEVDYAPFKMAYVKIKYIISYLVRIWELSLFNSEWKWCLTSYL